MGPTEPFWIPFRTANDKPILVSAGSANAFPFRLEFPPELPISARAEEITAAIQAHGVVILAGETGSGKTTQIPKMCLAAGRGQHGRIACTQPRRVAALSVSRRVAEELGVSWGREVGCKIRFSDETTRDTVIKFLTDGMLLAEVQGDALLREYDTIIIDEAHERSLNIDFLLGHLRTLRYKRPELKIIVTSATIDTAAFSKAFDDAPVVQVEGRTYPVEVIYAPLDELGSDYTDGDENEDRSDAAVVASARAEALHYIDGCVEAVERVVRDSATGDVLVFLPSERDIRELRDLLDGRRLRDCEVIPLFGRLSNAEQQRVFAPTQRRKVILATNVAETSLTIPGIRFVVDTGLARISRYSPQARTRRLPIEPVSQSSADQRKGRSGRVADGVCIRLYSEKDYLERPRFTQPEIQRANLADVILRMKAFGLGDIERFPFINMPATKSIRAGYALLEELGAIATEPPPGRRQAPPGASEEPPVESADLPAYSRQLTPIGRELARLPVDPTVGRMILQARAEKALREVLVIAAGLSVQDPRERPLDKQQQADAAHRRFVHPDSDFLTLLNIWETYHDEFEQLTQAKLRRFCRDHFLSYTRMREWRDVHAQLMDVLEEREDFKLTSAYHGLKTVDDTTTSHGTPAYRAIHRSILAGLLGNIGRYDEENQNYKATHDRRVVLFPGSVLFRRDESRRRPAGDAPRAPKPPRVPPWIMAAEIVETSRLYARTCARLDPLWALDLASHLVRRTHTEPTWNVESGRVMVKQRTRLYGLELESKSVGYGRINPEHATEIFIREALVNDTLTYPLDFLAHNRRVRENIEAILTRTRDAGYLNLDEAAYRFYAARLMTDPSAAEVAEAAATGVSAVGDLVALVRERRTAEPRFLMMAPEDLRDPAPLEHNTAAFPPELPLENRALPLNYAYKPGQPDDGVTLDVNTRQAAALRQADLDWAVPGHLEAKVEHYLRALPKELRREFVPMAETVKSVAAQVAQRDRLTDRRETLTEALAFLIAERFRVAVEPAAWADRPLPDHLRVRIRVLDANGRELVASRELAEIRAGLDRQTQEASATMASDEPPVWRRARAKWERPSDRSWTFGDVPARVVVTEQAGVPVYAYPALVRERDGVALRLVESAAEAAALSEIGAAQLLEYELSRELVWLERDLRALREVGPLAATLRPLAELQADALEGLRRWLCDPARVSPPAAHVDGGGFRAQEFSAAITVAKADLQGLVGRTTDLLREILSLRQSLLVVPRPHPGLGAELDALIPPDFLRRTPFPQLAHFPRFLRAMLLRTERWQKNPAKDAERAAQLAPYVQAAQALLRSAGASPTPSNSRAKSAPGTAAMPPIAMAAAERFRWLVEEYRVSVFAQELGTAQPVSTTKLDRELAGLRAGTTLRPAPATSRAAEPASVRPLPVSADKKPAPIKTLGALDKLFQR